MMKSILSVMMVLLMCGSAAACGQPCCKDGAQGPVGEQGIPGQDYDNGKRQNPGGVGLDYMLLQTKSGKVGLEAQFKHDDRNNEQSYFAVVKINPWAGK